MKHSFLFLSLIMIQMGVAKAAAVEDVKLRELDVFSVEDKSCETPIGRIPDGGSLQGYLTPLVSAGEKCIQGEITCSDGYWSGAYINQACAEMGPN